MAQTRLQRTDVVIIGMGATGGVAALELANAGIHVVGLEAGGRIGPRDYPSDEIRQNIRNWMGRAKMNNEVPTHRHNESETAVQRRTAGPMMNAVGGSSIHYACQSWRLSPWDHRVRSETINRYGERAIPAGSTVTDWPVTYDELEPYHDRVEHLIGVGGKAGNIQGEIDEEGNIFEGPRQREYPLPPLRWSGYGEMMAKAARSLGYHPFRGPASIMTEPFNDQPTCTYCGYCSGNGCHINAKGSTNLNAIPQAEATGNLKIVTYARATEIAVDREGRVSGVRYLRGGRRYFQPARVVLLATYTYENTRLLLLSTSDAYPNGLSNNHGQVGKHYMGHNTQGVNVSALFRGVNLNRMNGNFAQGVGFDDFDGDNFDHTGLGFICGGNIWVGGGLTPISAATNVPLPDSVPRWGSEWKAWVKENANSWGSVYVQLSGIPYEDFYLDLDPNVRDPQGFPVCRITFDLKENERRGALYLQEKVVEWFEAAGATETFTSPPQPQNAATHAYGGTRMGPDPDQDVVDEWCFSHEAPNLGVLGASCFPTTGGRNPTQQAQALAIRTAEHLVENWDSIAA